jgi:hypothetical protein
VIVVASVILRSGVAGVEGRGKCIATPQTVCA